MRHQTKQIPSGRDRRLERAIVSQTLRDDHDRRWSRAELAAELDHIDHTDPRALQAALTRLTDRGVVELAHGTLQASCATVYLDELDMISV